MAKKINPCKLCGTQTNCYDGCYEYKVYKGIATEEETKEYNDYKKFFSGNWKKEKKNAKFLGGPVMEYRHLGNLYQFCVAHNCIAICITDENDKEIVYKEFKGKKFKQFVKYITEWLEVGIVK